MAGNARPRFMFVEYSAPVKLVQGQKRRRGGPKEVRAFITQEFHRKLRMKRLCALKALTLPDRSKGETLSSEMDTGERWGEGDEQKEGDLDADADSNGNGESDPPSHFSRPPEGSSWPSTILPHLQQTTLGEGRMDPFDALPVSRVPLFIHMVLDHAIAHSWPRTIPVRSAAQALNPVRSAWLQCAMEHPVLFHAFIFATTFHLLSLHGGREISQRAPEWRLLHKVETIKLVKEQLRKLDDNHDRDPDADDADADAETTMPSDALVMAVAILAIHGRREDGPALTLHPASPLAEAQNLHVYGDLRNDEEHVQGIILLVSKKGGLDGMRLYGLADTMQLCDLYFASKYANRPLFPWRRPRESLVASGKHLLDAVAIDLDSNLGRGFRYLRASPAGHDLLEILQAYCEVTTAVDHYARKGPTAPELVDLIEARNAAQHRLLCQMPVSLDLSEPTAAVLQATRLATLIFSDMAIFPLPPVQGVKPRLALLLRQTLEACTSLGCWELHGQLLMWTLTMGAIAAAFTSDRAWYTHQLAMRVPAFQFDEWGALEALCSRYLWWEPVCRPPGLQLWAEMDFPASLGPI